MSLATRQRRFRRLRDERKFLTHVRNRTLVLQYPLQSLERLSNPDTSNKPKQNYRGADKSLARPGRKQAIATEDFEFHIS